MEYRRLPAAIRDAAKDQAGLVKAGLILM